ncbi:MAG TPA: acyltransferase domain-containing protein, partial [Streptosporangiaceae bacterium]
MQNGLLPPTLHAGEPSPHVDWSAGNVRLLAGPEPWPAGDRPRRAGVSSFGFSGTNAHVILQEAAAVEPGAEAAPSDPLLTSAPATWLVSGRTAPGLSAQAGRLSRWITARPDLEPADVGWSLATTRSVFEHRAVVIGADRAELAGGLAAVAAGQPAAGVITGEVPGGGPGKVVFVFPGQGGQWPGMGRDLAGVSPLFAARLAECGRALRQFVEWDLEQVLTGGEGAPGLDRVDVVQPVLWAVMVSLAAVWQAAGVRPDAVAGHSQGEIAAATVAGVLSLEDAARVVALRSKALVALAGHGSMASVAEPAERVRQRLAEWGGTLSVAAINGPAATVVTGEPAALAELISQCTADGIRARQVEVDYASHGPQVEQIRDQILADLAPVVPGIAEIPLVSAMTGQWMRGPELGAQYWYESLRAPVEFQAAVRALTGSGHGVFIETSPHPVLATVIAETGEDAQLPVTVTGTLRRDDGGQARLLASLAAAHVAGISVNWAAVLPAGRPAELPTYAFQHQRYWPGPRPVPVAVGSDGTGAAAEARFWAAVEDGDARMLAGVLAVEDQRLAGVLPALAAWRRKERSESAVAGWRYRVTWVPVPDPQAGALAGTWLVAVPAGAAQGLARACCRALAARGAQVVVLETAGTLDRATAGRIVRALPGLAGVASLLALDQTPLPAEPAVPGGLAGTLTLIQALGDAGTAAPLWALTQGAVATVPGELPEPAQAMTWGLGRVAGLEHPDRWGGLIDLPAVLDERAAARLCAVLAGPGGEDQLAIRATATLARRLVRAPQPGTGDTSWTPHGTTVITGGTGAVGGHVARWLVRRGA